MAHTNHHIDPLSTRSTLKSLGYAIDEIKLVRSIHRLSEQARLGAGVQIDPGRQRYLVTEIRSLNDRLETLREKARLLDCSI